MNTVIIDSVANKKRHVDFNLNFIEVVQKATKNAAVTFCSDIAYIEDNGFSNLTNVDTMPIVNTSYVRPTKLAFLIKPIISLVNIIHIIALKKPTQIFIMEANNYDVISTYLVSVFNKKINFIFLLHGEIGNEFRKDNNPKLFTSFLHLFLLRKMGRKLRAKLIFLENHIKDNIIAIVPGIESFSFVVEHPINTSKIKIFNVDNTINTDQDLQKIAYFGTATIDKGFPEFLTLASSLKNKFDFMCCTKDSKGILKKHLDNGEKYKFSIGPFENSLEYKQYEKLFDICDFVLLILKPGYYDYAASGVLCDCIKNEIPIIGLNTPYIKSLTQKYGPFGVFFDNVEELLISMQNIKIEEVDIQGYRQNLRKIKNNRSLDNSSIILSKVIELNVK